MKDDFYRGLPTIKCPVCLYEMEAATGVGEIKGPPKEGDLSICLKCGTVQIFKADGTGRKMEDTDWASFDKHTKKELFKAQHIIASMNLKN